MKNLPPPFISDSERKICDFMHGMKLLCLSHYVSFTGRAIRMRWFVCVNEIYSIHKMVRALFRETSKLTGNFKWSATLNNLWSDKFPNNFQANELKIRDSNVRRSVVASDLLAARLDFEIESNFSAISVFHLYNAMQWKAKWNKLASRPTDQAGHAIFRFT